MAQIFVTNKAVNNNGIPEVSVEQVDSCKNQVLLIDVRRPDEFVGELKHIPKAVLVTQGPDLTNYLEKLDKNKEIVFVCRSGARSGNATLQGLQMGFKNVANMAGGMIAWNNKKFSVE